MSIKILRMLFTSKACLDIMYFLTRQYTHTSSYLYEKQKSRRRKKEEENEEEFFPIVTSHQDFAGSRDVVLAR